MQAQDVKVRFTSMLRRAGLGNVPVSVVICIGVMCVALVIVAVVQFWPQESEDFYVQSSASQDDSDAADAAEAQEKQPAALLAVDVEGAVITPGLYHLEEGMRVSDAIAAAGGLAEDAVQSSVNLARKLVDGEQIYVASSAESASVAAAGSASASASASASSGSAQSKISINSASVDELQELQGIGPSIAQRIVDYRTTNGPFESLEDIQEVSGIGEARYEAIKDSICL